VIIFFFSVLFLLMLTSPGPATKRRPIIDDDDEDFDASFATTTTTAVPQASEASSDAAAATSAPTANENSVSTAHVASSKQNHILQPTVSSPKSPSNRNALPLSSANNHGDSLANNGHVLQSESSPRRGGGPQMKREEPSPLVPPPSLSGGSNAAAGNKRKQLDMHDEDEDDDDVFSVRHGDVGKKSTSLETSASKRIAAAENHALSHPVPSSPKQSSVKPKPAPPSKPVAVKREIKSSSSSSSAARPKSIKPSSSSSTAAVKPRRVLKRTEDDFEPANRWWEKTLNDQGEEDEHRWFSLEHKGMMFTPAYVPHNIPLRIKSSSSTEQPKLIRLPAEVEEVATYFASTVSTRAEMMKFFLARY
jgi:hypothetical protein